MPTQPRPTQSSISKPPRKPASSSRQPATRGKKGSGATDAASGKEKHHRGIFDVFSVAVSSWSGKPVAFVAAFLLVVVWGISGPFFGYSETWQLVINTGTTIITFLMVFVLQNSQNRDSEAVQTKLDELILSSHAANDFVGIEKLDEKQLRKLSESLKSHSERLGKRAEDLSSAEDN